VNDDSPVRGWTSIPGQGREAGAFVNYSRKGLVRINLIVDATRTRTRMRTRTRKEGRGEPPPGGKIYSSERPVLIGIRGEEPLNHTVRLTVDARPRYVIVAESTVHLPGSPSP